MTTKEEMMVVLDRVQGLQRMAMGIVSTEINVRNFDGDDWGVLVIVTDPAYAKDKNACSDPFRYYNFYAHNEAQENKVVMRNLVNQLKEWGAL